MRLSPYIVVALLLAAPALQAQTQQAKEPIKVTDLLKIKTIGEIHLSKKGSQAVFTLTTIEPDTSIKTSKWDYKYLTQLYLTSADGSTSPRQLTTAKEGATQPAWSPDGRQIAFVRPIDGKTQIFILSLDGGEPIQLTHSRYGASSPKWSPDGQDLLFASRINLKELIKDSTLNPGHALPAWPFEKPGMADNGSLRPNTAKADPDGSLAEIRAWLDVNVADKKAKVVTKLNFQDEMEVNPDEVFTHWFTQAVQPAQSTQPGQPMQSAQAGTSPTEVTHGFYSYNSADYTPDGKSLIVTAHIDSSEDPDRALESEIYLADRDGTYLHKLLGEKDKSFGNPTLSPDGLKLAYTESPTNSVAVPQLLVNTIGGSATPSIIPIDRSTAGLTWSDDGHWLYFVAQSNGGAPIYRVNPATPKTIEQLADYNTGATAFDLHDNHLLFARTEPADPSELYSADAAMANPKTVSGFNTPWLQKRQLSLPEKHSFKNALGETVEYWVMKPIGYAGAKSRHYPLLLDIHGGPAAMWGPGEPSMWHEFQYFCSKGFGVVYCNPRGSGGYGQDFLRANIKDWGTGPTSDVLTALDKTVAEGWADTARLVVTGGSYAGYLTAWIVGHDHRFKAACAQRGVYDLATFFGEGNAWRLVSNYFGGYPWEPAARAVLEHESPITYVADITTPLLIFHGENDRRTGFVQGEMLYRSLKVMGRPVEYVRHPGATHELTRSGDNRQRVDQMLRTYEFFARYITPTGN
jgi:dipeptidyl aminopeptidase/acylaminoacyl peptidase